MDCLVSAEFWCSGANRWRMIWHRWISPKKGCHQQTTVETKNDHVFYRFLFGSTFRFTFLEMFFPKSVGGTVSAPLVKSTSRSLSPSWKHFVVSSRKRCGPLEISIWLRENISETWVWNFEISIWPLQPTSVSIFQSQHLSVGTALGRFWCTLNLAITDERFRVELNLMVAKMSTWMAPGSKSIRVVSIQIGNLVSKWTVRLIIPNKKV